MGKSTNFSSSFNKDNESVLRKVRGLTDKTDESDNNKKTIGSVPWNNLPSDSEEQAFFRPWEIKGDRWNKLFPYRLVVVDVTDAKNPKIVPTKSIVDGNAQARSTFNVINSESGISYVLNQEIITGNWVVNLPITPQQLQITDQYAINTTATMRGIVEEHNGLKFKNITMAGTTGIWPLRPTIGGEIKSPSSLQTIFAGTIGGFNQVLDGFNSIKKAFNGEHPNNSGKSDKPEDTVDAIFATGYYQMQYLGQFLERYVQAKRRPENKNWRLVLDIPKQNQSFVVTPIAFTFKQDHQKPNEMFYNMQLKAWKRIELNLPANSADQDRLPTLTVNDFQRLVNTLREVRRTLGDASNLIKSVRSDFQRTFNILRQTTLAVKDLGGIVFSVADLPRQIIEDFKSTIEDSATNLTEAFMRPNDLLRDTAGAGGFTASAVALKQSSSAQKAGQTQEALLQKRSVNEGLSSGQVSSGSLGINAIDALATDPINNIFQNPEENFDFFDTITTDDLELTPQQEIAIEDEAARVSLLNIDDFRDFKAEMLALYLDISNSFGAGDQTYSDIYGTAEPRSRPIPMSIEENEILAALFNAIQVYDELTATKFFDDLETEDPFEFVGGLADETDIDFEDFPTKIPVPVPFGLNIEEIAARYMENADKWLEIVTVNKLRSPYIDEDGFLISFLSNGDGRQFTIFDSEDRLFIGQKILLQSDSVIQFSRKIINLEEISENNFLVTVDSTANLDNLTTVDNARMQGFLPGTVNSQNQIFIPIDGAADADDGIFEIPGVSDNFLAKISKVDFLLTDQFDVAINTVGDFRLATGLNNLIQALKLKIRTQKGTLLRHLEYGLGLEAGISVADIERGAVIDSLNRMVEDDPRFEGISRISLRLEGSTLGVDLSVRLANGTGVLPISLDVPVR